MNETTCSCYSWEMAFNAGLDASFDNIQNWKEIREKTEEVNSWVAYKSIDENCIEFSADVAVMYI